MAADFGVAVTLCLSSDCRITCQNGVIPKLPYLPTGPCVYIPIDQAMCALHQKAIALVIVLCTSNSKRSAGYPLRSGRLIALDVDLPCPLPHGRGVVPSLYPEQRINGDTEGLFISQGHLRGEPCLFVDQVGQRRTAYANDLRGSDDLMIQ